MKIIKLTEQELIDLIKKVITEQRAMGLIDPPSEETEDVDMTAIKDIVKQAGGSCVLASEGDKIMIIVGNKKYGVKNIMTNDNKDYYGNISYGTNTLLNLLKNNRQIPGKIVNLKQGINDNQNWMSDEIQFKFGSTLFLINARVFMKF